MKCDRFVFGGEETAGHSTPMKCDRFVAGGEETFAPDDAFGGKGVSPGAERAAAAARRGDVTDKSTMSWPPQLNKEPGCIFDDAAASGSARRSCASEVLRIIGSLGCCQLFFRKVKAWHQLLWRDLGLVDFSATQRVISEDEPGQRLVGQSTMVETVFVCRCIFPPLLTNYT